MKKQIKIPKKAYIKSRNTGIPTNKRLKRSRKKIKENQNLLILMKRIYIGMFLKHYTIYLLKKMKLEWVIQQYFI